MLPLPVDSLLPELIERLQHNSSVIVQAPPGSGKTTRIAPALIDAGLCDHENRTFLLQPRRVAAKATAQRISDERGVRLGQQVGYQVRFENKISDKSALIVATEGILLRKLSVDPTLDGIGTVILDEFHERSLNADLILAMLRQIQQVVRDDLRLIVMSATLDIEPLKRFLDAPVLHSAGTLHPVEIKYRQPRARQKLTEHVAETVALTAQATEGDMLVFLPGVGEISQTETLLKREPVPGCQVLPLHGSMPLEKQSQVLRSNGEGSAAKRRIILSTNVAETSLTIEGIRTVVDSGQARVLRFSPSVGLDRLLLEPICQSSATQRAGRAGRLDSGLCVRLWDEKTQRSRPEFLEPEVRRVDLTYAVLQLYQWGERPEDFPWLEPPSEESVTTAIELLEQLGAVRDRRITELGQQMCALPTSPRLARMLISLKADAKTKSSQIETLSLVAAMISERDPFIRQHGNADRHSLQRHWNCDVTQRLLALQAYYDTGDSQTSLGEVHRGAARNIRMVAKQFASIVQDDLCDEPSSFERDTADDSSDEFVAKSLLLAFPDRLARRRKAGEAKGRMTGGRGVRLAHESGVHSPELFLCIDVDDRATEAIVRQASGIHADWLPADLIDEREELFFNPTRKQVEARRRVYFGDLMLSEQTATITKRDECEKLLYAQACQNLESIVPESSSKFQSWWTRMACLAQWSPELELPNCDDLLLKDLLIDLCPQKRSFDELKSAPWLDWLKSRLTPEQVQAIDRECPEKLEVPSGSRIKLEYEPGKPPVLAVRIQEVFSWRSTPRIAHGRVPVLLHLLAPNYRPQQITDDLASFWENTYDLVRKELMRRYPKHAWPDDPINAKPECKGGQRRS